MARTPSKIFSLAEKKSTIAGLKQAIKDNTVSVKESADTVALATKALATAKKQSDALVAEATKAVTKATKEGNSLIATAQKALDAATKKHVKLNDAAAKGRAKLDGQLEAIEAAPVTDDRKKTSAAPDASV